MKFCVKLGKFANETFAMFNTAYGDVVTKRTVFFNCHERFKGGRQSIDEDERPGHPSTSTDDSHVDKINTLVRANRRLTIRELAEEFLVFLRDFDRKIEDAPHRCEICARKPIASAFFRNCLIVQMKMKTPCQEL